MKFQRKPHTQVEIGLAPLIDVVFILLLFFVVTTTFTRETQLKVELPAASSGDPAEAPKQQLEILIDVEGRFQLNGKALAVSDLEHLEQALIREGGTDRTQPVVISADGRAPHQAVVTAMDAAGQGGFSHLRITTVEAPEGE